MDVVAADERGVLIIVQRIKPNHLISRSTPSHEPGVDEMESCAVNKTTKAWLVALHNSLHKLPYGALQVATFARNP